MIKRENSEHTIDHADVVIVGNGIAGLTAAVEVRRLEPEKNIVIMTNQSHPTINTPALKQFAVGKLAREQLLAYPAGTERLERIHVVNTHVEEIRAQSHFLCLAGGRGFGYDELLLATGSRPTGLGRDIPGQDFDGVLTLHRLNDYLDLRRRLNEVEEVVVIGGGSHAIETVMGLLYLGIQVHWLIRSETLLPHVLDRPASEMVLESVRRAGAHVYTETEIVGIVGRVGVVAGVVTKTRQMVPCQLVLICTGTAPVTDLARHCDLPMKHQYGIQVDDRLRTSVRNVYAAGDVAALRDPLTGKYAPRAQWYSAVLQGRTVAASITGRGEPESFGVPWHATRLGDFSMLTVGSSLGDSEYVVPLTEQHKGSYHRLLLVDDRLVGYLAIGSRPPDSLAIKRLIDEGLSIRDIKKELLRGEFDARKYFSGKRTYAVQRMITTGQMPTPLPPVPGIIGGQRRAMPRPSEPGAPLQRRSHVSGVYTGQALPPGAQQTGASRPLPAPGEGMLPDTDPLVRPLAWSGQHRAVNPVPPFQPSAPQPALPPRTVPPAEQRRRAVAEQATLLPPDPQRHVLADQTTVPVPGKPQQTGRSAAVPPRPTFLPAQPPPARSETKQDSSWLNAGPQPVAQATGEIVTRRPGQQFVAPFDENHFAEDENPHPTRSIWHYTDKHPAIKRKNNVPQ
jgi:NADPH-dependent 2,4-dienoyl-CoA reductase/sulfur reductase-like enzyme